MGLREDLAQERDRLAQEGQTEFRPGQRQVSLQEDLRNMRQALEPEEPKTSVRFPLGATVFGVGAGIAASPLGPAPAMATAAMASGIGEVVQSTIEALIDSPNQPKDVPDFLNRIGKEVMLGSVAEGVGRGLVKGAEKAKFLFFTPRRVTGEAREAMQFLEKEGVELPLLPSKATESRSLDLLHNISEHSFTGGHNIQRFVENEQAFMVDLADSLAGKIAAASTPEDAAEVLLASANNNLKEARVPATVLYNSLMETIAPKVVKKEVVEEVPTGFFDAQGRAATKTVVREKEVLSGGLRMNIRDIKAFVKQKADVQTRLAHIGDEVTGGSLLDRFAKLADRPYVSDMIDMRTNIRGIKEGMQAGLATKKDPAIGMLKTIEAQLSARIDNTLKAKNPILWATKQQADLIWKQGSKTFNNKFIRALGSKMDIERVGAPERVVDAIFAPRALTRMKAIKGAVSPKAWKTISRQGMERILALSKDKETGVIVGKNLLEKLTGPSGLGERGLVEAVGPIEAQRWISFANAAKIQQKRQAAGEGSMLIQLKQPGAVLNLVEVGGASLIGLGESTDQDLLTTGGAVILGLPFIAGKVMTNPTAARALIDGMKPGTLKAGSTAAGIVTRLMGALVPRQVERPSTTKDRAAIPTTLRGGRTTQASRSASLTQ